MTEKNAYLQVSCFMALANNYSPLLRDALIPRSIIVNQLEIELDATISFNADNLSFRYSQLFPAIVKAYDKVTTPIIKSIEGDEWAVVFDEDADPPNVVLEHNGQRLSAAQFALLAPEAEVRLYSLQLIANQHLLRRTVVDQWRVLLSDRRPTEHEIMAFSDDLRNTPIGATEAILESLERGYLSFDTLVPDSEAYYRQLVGGAGNATTLEDYIAEITEPLIAELLKEGFQQPLRQLWSLCSHSSISQLINREWAGDTSILAEEILWLAKNGDPISQTGAIEFGLRQLEKHPVLLQSLTELVNAFIAHEPDDDTFHLLSALFGCIYGQMARRRILTTWSPFARRHAALAHASLVFRNFLTASGELSGLVRWLRGNNQDYFYLQILLDMRVEPRWRSGFSSAEQWRNELFGRVCVAANLESMAVKSLGLGEQLVGEGPNTVIHKIDRMAIYLPGPLEGGVAPSNELSPEYVAQIEDELKGLIDTASFNSLIHISLYFLIPDHLIDKAAEAIERHHYEIPIHEQVALNDCLFGLASVAAVSRHVKLLESIHKTLIVNWRLNLGQLTALDAFEIGMLACAAHADLTEWSTYVGHFMTELSLRDLDRNDAEVLYSYLTIMCHLVPELWGFCGQAQAALGLVVGK